MTKVVHSTNQRTIKKFNNYYINQYIYKYHNRISSLNNIIKMIYRLPSGVSFRPSEILFRRIISNRLSNAEELRIPFRRFFQRYIDEREDEQFKEEKTNPNFMEEKNMNFRLYPFYINWKKIEANDPGYYRILVHYGYFGAAVYSSFKEKYPSLDVNNVLFILAGFINEYLLKPENDKTDIIKTTINDFFEKMPNLNELYELMEKKIIMMKEVPVIILILKIYEIDFILKKDDTNIENILKYEYLLLTYLTDNEYKDIYKSNFDGKVKKIFKKIVQDNGKDYILPRTKEKFINHIKSIYKNIKKN